VEESDAAIVPAPPHPLERDRTPEELLRTHYEWTLAAHRDYEQRRLENERRERRRAEWLERMRRQGDAGGTAHASGGQQLRQSQRLSQPVPAEVEDGTVGAGPRGPAVMKNSDMSRLGPATQRSTS